MAIPQLTIPDDNPPMLPGQLATADPAHFQGYRSATVEGVFGDVAFAVPGEPDGFTHTVSAGDELGVVLFSHDLPTTPVPATGDVIVTHPLNVLRKGVVWVTTVAAVTDVTAPVTYGVAGKFTVGGANTIANARWRTLAGAGEVVQVELNLP